MPLEEMSIECGVKMTLYIIVVYVSIVFNEWRLLPC